MEYDDALRAECNYCQRNDGGYPGPECYACELDGEVVEQFIPVAEIVEFKKL